MYAALLILSGCNPVDLGSESYSLRESTERRIRAAGLLAVPGLIDAMGSPDPEVRHRANRLLRPWRSLCLSLRAADVILSPWEPGWAWLDDAYLRQRMYRLARAHGMPHCRVYDLLPDSKHAPWAWIDLRLVRRTLAGRERGWLER